MNCQKINQILLQDSINEIPAQIRQEIDKHLEECPQCRMNFLLTQIENEVLKEPSPVPSIHPDFIEKTMQLLPKDLYKNPHPGAEAVQAEKIESQKEVPSHEHSRRRLHHSYLGIAASVLLLLGGSLYFRQDIINEFSPPASSSYMVAEQNDMNNTPDLNARTVISDKSSENNPEVQSSASEENRTSENIISDSGTLPSQPEIYDAQDSSDFVTASKELKSVTNPYQYAPASAYESSITPYLLTSRSNQGTENDNSDITAVSKANHSVFPKIVLSCLPEHFRLIDFSSEESVYTFQYQDDFLHQLDFKVTPYTSSESPEDIPGDGVIYRLIVSGDITYHVTLTGSFSENELQQILNQIQIEES